MGTKNLKRSIVVTRNGLVTMVDC